jgi:SNF2 family DNA or RNA helicase
LINCAKNKLLAAVDIIATKHASERIRVFSETIESIQKLKEMLQNKGIKSMLIDSKLNSKKRQKILSEWGKEFFPLLSVHAGLCIQLLREAEVRPALAICVTVAFVAYNNILTTC